VPALSPFDVDDFLFHQLGRLVSEAPKPCARGGSPNLTLLFRTDKKFRLDRYRGTLTFFTLVDRHLT